MHLDLCKKTGDKFTADEFNQIISAINAKVEQEAGKALSDENFTAEEKQFLATLAAKDIVKMITDEITRATEAEGTLSSSISRLSKDFTDFISDTADADNVINRFHEIVAFLSGIAETDTLEGMFSEMSSSVSQSITTAISDFEVKIKLFISQNYQPKESGKGLSANDYTTAEKEKLAGLANYDDTAITKSINDEITRSKAAEAALSGKLDELSKVALADVGYFAIEYGDEEDSSQADPAVTIINQPYYDYFMAKWEAANKPCEKKLDGTDFAYLQDDVTLRADGSSSHLEDANYFQGAEMINFNISYFYDAINKKSRVFFNLDKEAPCGYHRFIPYESILMPRYNQYVEGDKIKTCSNYQVINNQSVQDFCNVLSATSADMLGYTWWQNVCLAWLAVAKYQTRDIQANLPGMTTGQDTYGRFKNGLLDSKHQATGQWTVTATRYSNTVVGEVATESFKFKPYKLWWCENLLHGDAWIRCFGGITKLVDGKRYLYFTRDPEVASVKATVDANDATKFEDKVEVACNLTEGSYIKKINGMYPVPLVNNGSSTTCFCDDTIFISNNKQAVRSAVTYYMQKVTEGGQTVKSNWSIHKVSDKNMVDFLGVRIGVTHRKLRKRNRKEIESRLSELRHSSDYFECERSWAGMNGSFKNINMSNLINYWKDVYPDFFDRLQWAKTAHVSAAAYKRKHRKMEIELQSAKDCRTYKIPFFGNAGFNPDGTMAVLFRTIGQHKRC